MKKRQDKQGDAEPNDLFYEVNDDIIMYNINNIIVACGVLRSQTEYILIYLGKAFQSSLRVHCSRLRYQQSRIQIHCARQPDSHADRGCYTCIHLKPCSWRWAWQHCSAYLARRSHETSPFHLWYHSKPITMAAATTHQNIDLSTPRKTRWQSSRSTPA